MAKAAKASTHGIVETNHFSFVDGLRGVAILAIVAVKPIR
jgi:hypothetical protein